MPDRSKLACAAAALLLAVSCGGGSEAPRGIVLISIDTLRADYLNLYGYERHETSPELDAFARDALVFDHCVVTEPHTLTSHMSLFTGLHPQRHRVDRRTALATDVATLASELRRRGFATAGFADAGYLIRLFGFDRGFDVYEARRRRGLARILDEGRDWLRLHGAFPFFLFLHGYDVHSRGPVPLYEAPEPFRGRFSGAHASPLADASRPFRSLFASRRERLSEEDRAYIRATYAEGVRYVDSLLGGFFAFLREEGLYDDALVVVWSDHGEGLGDHEEWLHRELYDASVRCVLLMKIPGLAGGRRIESVVSAVDIAPTLLELVHAPAPRGIDGRSFAAKLSGAAVGGAAFTRDGDGQRFSIRTATHQLLWDRTDGSWELYDLEADPGETRNLSPSGGEVEARLRERLRAWVARHDAERRRGRPGPPADLDAGAEAQLRELGYLE